MVATYTRPNSPNAGDEVATADPIVAGIGASDDSISTGQQAIETLSTEL
jgi:hypothetical protein